MPSIGSFMYRQSGTRGNQQPHRHHPSSHAPNPHSCSIVEKNQSRLRLFIVATTKSAATTPAPAAAGKNTRSATGYSALRAEQAPLPAAHPPCLPAAQKSHARHGWKRASVRDSSLSRLDLAVTGKLIYATFPPSRGTGKVYPFSRVGLLCLYRDEGVCCVVRAS